jgi:hypothetical protein
MYNLYNKNQAYENRKWWKRTAGVIIPVIRNQLVFVLCGFSLPSINNNYLCQISIKQSHQYVCLIWRRTWMTYPHTYSFILFNSRVELIPRTNGNGYRNVQVMVFERECLIVVCLQSTRTLFVNEQYVIVSIIIQIITVLFVELCCIGEVTSERKAGISFIFPWFLVDWHADLNVSCSNLTADKHFYL